ncbi:MAG: hypothetical protein ACK5DJ_08630 [Bacteroidota bacterium]
MRIKFRRMLIPAFTLVFSIVSGGWFYTSYTDLDLFTVKNLDSQAGPCSDVDIKPFGDFQAKGLSFLTQDSDSNLLATIHSNNDLLKSFQVEMGCYSSDQIRNLALDSKTCLKKLISLRLFQLNMKLMENSRRSLFIPRNESTDSLMRSLMSVLLQDHASQSLHIASDSTHVDTSFSLLTQSSPVQSADSLKSQLSSLISKMNSSYLVFMTDREVESTRLAEARLEHGLRMGEARTRLFLLTLIFWFVSLSLMSALYLKSVFRRSTTIPVVSGNDDPTEGRGIAAGNAIGSEPVVSSDTPAVLLDYDLTKVFFDSGGDIQVMKRRLNQHLVSSFAAIGNLKSYQRSGNADGAIRILQVLSESNESLGFIDLKNRLDEVCSSIRKSGNDSAQWSGLDSILNQLTNQIEVIKERMDHHPAFKG